MGDSDAGREPDGRPAHFTVLDHLHVRVLDLLRCKVPVGTTEQLNPLVNLELDGFAVLAVLDTAAITDQLNNMMPTSIRDNPTAGSRHDSTTPGATATWGRSSTLPPPRGGAELRHGSTGSTKTTSLPSLNEARFNAQSRGIRHPEAAPG
jgi:hypothetical protein